MRSIAEVLGFIWGYWWRRPGMLFSLVGFMGFATLLDVALPPVAGWLIDAIAGSGAVPGSADVRTAAALLAVMVGLSGVSHLSRYVAFRIWIIYAAEVMRDMVAESFGRVQRYSSDWHANNFAGSTVRKISRGMWAYDRIADILYIGFMPALMLLLGLSVMLLLRWPAIGLFLLAGVVVYCGSSMILATRYCAPANRVSNNMDSALGAALADSITCNAVVKSFSGEVREDDRVRGAGEDWRQATVRSWNRLVNMELVQMVILTGIQLGLLGLALWFWARGEANAGDVTVVMTSYFLIHGYLREFGDQMRDLQQAVNEMEDVVAFSKRPFGVPDAADAAALQPVANQVGGEIVFDDVMFRYDGQSAALYTNFSVKIGAGERVALVGKSGSGKSTFVKLIQRLYDIDSGRIMIDGQDVAACTQESLRRHVSVVPQEPVLFHRSLAENIAYGRPHASQDEIEAAARRANAHDFIMALPAGYGTLVGERGVKLSGGERQRVAIARAILADAPVLILDEATSSLDSITEEAIQAAMEELMRGRTTIIIAHRLATVRRADRILVFADGAVVEHGTHAELMARADGHYRELHHVQSAQMVG